MHGGGLALVCLLGLGLLPLGESQFRYGKCNSTVMAIIKEFQCRMGRPGGIMKMADDIEYTVSWAVKDFIAKEVKCVRTMFEVTDDEIFKGNFTTHIEYTNGTLVDRLDAVEESCGKISATAANIIYYPVWFNGLVCFKYACTMDESVAIDIGPAMWMTNAKGHTPTEKECEMMTSLFALFGFTDDLVDYRQQCPTCPNPSRRSPMDSMGMARM